MRFGLIAALVLSLGALPARAQIQLLPQAASPAKPAAKEPKPEREAATRGNFPRRMKREEIEALFFTGEPVEASGLGRASFQVTFLKDGTARRLNHVNNEAKNGKWRFLGDGYCSKWEGSGEGCYTIVKDGDTYKVVRGTRAIAFWTPPGAREQKMQASPPAETVPPAEQPAAEIQKSPGKGDLLQPQEPDPASAGSEEEESEEN